MTNNSKSKKQVVKRVQQHSFRSVRDPVVNDATNGSNPTMYTLTTDSTGNATNQFAFSPFGVQSVTVSSTGVLGTGGYQNAFLPWLFNQARNFEMYRVTRATLCVVGNGGSTSTGRLLVDSTTDLADMATGVTLATSTGGKVFDVANLATKEVKVPMDIDSTWKKCSNRTCLINTTTNSFVPVSSANDLAFTTLILAAAAVTTAGTAASGTIVAQFFMEYDVEFKQPTSYVANV